MNNKLEILTVEEVMDNLYIGRNAVYKLLGSGEIKGFKIGKTWKIPQSSLEEYIKKQCKKLNDCQWYTNMI